MTTTSESPRTTGFAGVFNHPVTPIVTVAVMLIFAFWAYSLAFSGTWYFDDEWNLGGLSRIQDLETGLQFILDGRAGPSGRPLSLLTFALQASSWPDHIQAFLRANVLIHLFNGALVFVIAHQLAKLLGQDDRRVLWFAAAVAAAWTLSPFLASTSLMVVQRMTSLSASFLFAGMAVYLWGRSQVNQKLGKGVALMTLGAGLGTILATLAKENGALLPVLLLVAELTLLAKFAPIQSAGARRWIWLILGLPTLAILFYLSLRALQPTGFLHRDFSMGERLLTQCRILWDYIANLFAPRQSAVVPFADDYSASRGLFSPLSTFLGLLGLLGVTIFAWLARNRWPTLLFGWVFFLAGHLVESTVISLELFFAHRNYVPAFGLFFAAAALLIFSPASAGARKIAGIALGCWILLSALILADTASVWGRPSLAAELWYRDHPGSPRSAQFLGGQYLVEGDRAGAAKVFDQALELNPDSAWLELQALQVCMGTPEQLSARWERARAKQLAEPVLNFSSANLLRELAQANIRGQCNFASNEKLLDFFETLYSQRDRVLNDYVRHHLAYTLAELAHALERHDYAIARLEEAFDIHPSAENAIMIAYQHLEDDDREAAIERLDQALASPPEMLELRLGYQEKLWSYRQQIKEDNTPTGTPDQDDERLPEPFEP